jgi:hypothetical protein
MLKFIKDPDYFIIEETIIHGPGTSYTNVIYYTKDIHKKRINDDPWRKTTMADREWFNKYYRPKFEEITNG